MAVLLLLRSLDEIEILLSDVFIEVVAINALLVPSRTA